MALLLSRSKSIAHFLKNKISFSDHVSQTNFSSRILGLESFGIRVFGLLDNSLSGLAGFRRFESSMVGEQVEVIEYCTDDEDGVEEGVGFPGGRVTFTNQMNFLSESTDRRIPCYRLLDEDGYLVEGERIEKLDKPTCVKMYESMVTLSMMDTVFYEAQRQGRISFYMTTLGEEAVGVATAAALSEQDLILPQYREPGILLWRGFTLQEFANQLFGTKDDHGKARQMPVHFTSKQHNFFTVSSPIATQLPQAAGVAYALKMENKKACAVAFIGDGGTSEGDFHAGLNFAAVTDAPVMFVCRNNGWAISTPVSEQFRSDGIVVKGPAYGIRSIRVDGNDTLAIYCAVRAAREMVINEQKPVLVEALTYRVGHHSTSDDSTRYRLTHEIDEWKMGRNPMSKFRKWIERKGWWNDEAESELRVRIRQQLMHTIQVADQMDKPCLAEIFTDVYDCLPHNLYEQEKSLRETIKRHQNDYPSNVPF